MLRRLLLALLLLISGSTFAAEPFLPVGFVKLPAEATIGPMSAVAIDQQDRLYVLHRGTPPLLAFDAEGNYLRGWGADLFKVPHGLRVDAAGHIWTTDNGNHVLRKFDHEGKLLATIGTPGQAGSGKEGFRSPDDLVFDTAGNMFVADAGNGRIVKFSPRGEFLLEWGKKGKASGQFATTHGLAIDKQDRIYVADRGNKRVQVFDASGQHLADWSGFGNPFGLLAVGEELLATEGDIHRVFHLGSDGKIVAEWGDPKMLLLPHFLAINSQGVLFLAEVNGKRVQMFRRP